MNWLIRNRSSLWCCSSPFQGARRTPSLAPASSARTSTACRISGTPSATHSSRASIWKPAKKVFKREPIYSLTIEENRFGFEPEIVAKIACTGALLHEVAISSTGEPTPRARKSARKTASAPSAAFSNTACCVENFLTTECTESTVEKK